jgi:hypothetical protein
MDEGLKIIILQLFNDFSKSLCQNVKVLSLPASSHRKQNNWKFEKSKILNFFNEQNTTTNSWTTSMDMIIQNIDNIVVSEQK